MAIPSSYLTTVKNTRALLADIQKAGVPPSFTHEFLKQLGYASSSDRPFISVFKALGFLTDSGEPTDRYRRFKDPSQAPLVMAEALRDAYSDVYTIDQEAHLRTANELKGMFARLSDKGDSINSKMATTFKALAESADFKTPVVPLDEEKKPRAGEKPVPSVEKEVKPPVTPPSFESPLTLRHDIHVHLPISTDIEVYDAIFKSLRDNLGK